MIKQEQVAMKREHINEVHSPSSITTIEKYQRSIIEMHAFQLDQIQLQCAITLANIIHSKQLTIEEGEHATMEQQRYTCTTTATACRLHWEAIHDALIHGPVNSFTCLDPFQLRSHLDSLLF